jgi:hypothetical protein
MGDITVSEGVLMMVLTVVRYWAEMIEPWGESMLIILRYKIEAVSD